MRTFNRETQKEKPVQYNKALDGTLDLEISLRNRSILGETVSMQCRGHAYLHLITLFQQHVQLSFLLHLPTPL